MNSRKSSPRISLFDALRRHLEPGLLELGYSKGVPCSTRPSSTLLFGYDHGAESVVLSCQRSDRAQLVDLLGSQFAVGLGSLKQPDSAVRIWMLLNSTERELFAQVHESVCARIPLTVTTRASLDVPKEWSRYIWSMTAPINSQLAGVDHWLRYRDDQDIQAWCRFLLPLVPTLHDRARGLATGGAA